MGRSQASKRQGWFCTDEACAWFGGKVFSPITGKKFDILNVRGARDNVVKAFREASWRGNVAKTGEEWLPGGLVRLFRQETAAQLGKDAPVYLPQVKGPSRMGMFDKNKSISGNKKNFKKACDKEKAREWTPLGFIVGVDATQEGGRRDRAAYKARKGDSFRGFPEWLKGPRGGIGHAVAVNCKGTVVADTAPKATPRRKMSQAYILTIPNLAPGEDRSLRGGGGVLPKMMKDVADYFLGPDSKAPLGRARSPFDADILRQSKKGRHGPDASVWGDIL